MFLINIGGFLFLCLFISWHYKEQLVTVLPCGAGILIFLLYILAFFQKLSAINIISACFILLGMVLMAKRKDVLYYFRNEIFSASSITMFIIYLLVFLLIKDRMIIHWDELGVWGLEVKSIYFVNGFADKFKFTAIGYADYFPGQGLFEWWTCHFSPVVFKEGLAYVGYYWLYITFLMPVLKYIEFKKKYCIILSGIAITILFMLFPGITGTFGYRFLSAELLISAAFAQCLFQYIDLQKHDTRFSILNLIFCMMQLMLFKETGILYALMALLFGCIMLNVKKERDFFRNVDAMGCRGIIIVSLISSIPVIIWKVYCKKLGRIKYFDNATKYLVNALGEHNYKLDENAGLYVNSFLKSIFNEPLHEDKTIFMDITVIICVSLILFLIFYIYSNGYLTRKECWMTCVFYGISFILCSVVLICMHVFIFREKQYIETQIMIKSISRYLEPMFFGFLIFLFYFLISNDSKTVNRWKNIMLCISIILLCTNYQRAYDSVINYRNKTKVIVKDREDIILNYEDFFNDLKQIDSTKYSRVLYIEPVNNFGYERLFRYLVAPNSLIVQQVAPDKAVERFKEDIKFDVAKNHCDYIFFDDIGLEYLNAAFGEGAGCLENTLMSVNINENGDFIFNNVE